MSTLKVNTIQDASGNNGTTPALLYNGTAKAWVNFNGTGAVAIRGSYNVTSITDNGTGDYTVNFTSALADANYAAVATTQRSATDSNLFTSIKQGTTPTTAACRFQCQTGSAAAEDPPYVCAVFSR